MNNHCKILVKKYLLRYLPTQKRENTYMKLPSWYCSFHLGMLFFKWIVHIKYIHTVLHYLYSTSHEFSHFSEIRISISRKNTPSQLIFWITFSDNQSPTSSDRNARSLLQRQQTSNWLCLTWIPCRFLWTMSEFWHGHEGEVKTVGNSTASTTPSGLSDHNSLSDVSRQFK